MCNVHSLPIPCKSNFAQATTSALLNIDSRRKFTRVHVIATHVRCTSLVETLIYRIRRSVVRFLYIDIQPVGTLADHTNWHTITPFSPLVDVRANAKTFSKQHTKLSSNPRAILNFHLVKNDYVLS